jgi:stearoyl-CoA desaturase (delta-9 desaturase)
MPFGLIDLPWWGYVVYTLIVTHITIAAVTIYLHRGQAHRGLDLHPIASHFFRFWLWLTTGMVTREWVAIHRKHHAKCETAEDPHSPQIHGIRKLLLEGAELYRAEAKNRETLERYGAGTPDDWLERHLYTPRNSLGIIILLVATVIAFGPIGITIFAVQMLWIPTFAAGVINGIGHYWGYRNFQPEDASRNIVPWGILIGGEELHNNHHAYASSAKLSSKWYEFDIGWMYIRILEMLGLARVKKVAPRVRLDATKTEADASTLDAVITHRYDVLWRYRKALREIYFAEMRKLRAAGAALPHPDFASIRKWLHHDLSEMPDSIRQRVQALFAHSHPLQTAFQLRADLTRLWQRSTASRAELLAQLQDWCRRAEQSGLAPVQDFSRRLRCYA